jgi:hypothetical protein
MEKSTAPQFFSNLMRARIFLFRFWDLWRPRMSGGGAARLSWV